ncbi:MAG: histidine kinase [Clostridiaceae bacterium]|nr:histidine kinase [Eubacteriales bacterium]
MEKKRASGAVVAVFFLAFALFSGMSVYIEHGRQAREDEQLRYIASTVSAQVYEVLSVQMGKAKTLEAFVVQNNGGTEGFEKVARLLAADRVVRNVLLAPGGIVTDAYPLKGNESVIGHDLTGAAAGDKEAQTAIERGAMIMAGPFSLVQGGMGIAGRLPVYLNGSFWGLVSVTLNYPELFEGMSSVENLHAQGFACRLWRLNPDTGEEQTILSSGSGVLSRGFEQAFSIFNTVWHVSVYPEKPWYTRASVILSAALSLALSVSAAAGAGAYTTIRRMEREAAETHIAALQKQLEYDRINILLTQISSHFFYHTLNSIQALIVFNPDAAYRMTEDFSRFLRFKVDSVSAKDGLVPFREEMRSVRAYAEINRIQLDGRLTMEYDVFDADFLIPVLTVQPIVENAIIHGIKPKVGGGTVRVELKRGEGCYEVRVSDDGVGYTPDHEAAGQSVGISNIRTRMSRYPGCTIEIESGPGFGTSVLLRYSDSLGKEGA